ncbi:MAG TPA: lysine-sensitive aspartokinase 3 [Bacteroidota bacterium]|nr:lysine-sensitive aspartokinase 3 [Bacteroidota bacterium]
MIVMKFGGTSVQDAVAIQNVSRIIAARLGEKPLVIVSACAGATNALIRIAQKAGDGHEAPAIASLHELRDRHISIAGELLPGAHGSVLQSLQADFDELEQLVRSIVVLREVTPRTLDQVAAYGERWSSLLLHAALNHQGIPCEWIDARTVMATDNEFSHATPLLDTIEHRAQTSLLPLLHKGSVIVTQGFIGATLDGITTTLGRGGSDYSAAVLGAALGAAAIQIWTDVDGMMTADPTIISDAQLIKEMSFNEAAELAYFGAKVLHPSTILPAIRKNIPVWVLNSSRPESAGTLITHKSTQEPDSVVKSIAYKKGISVITVQSTRMLMSYGFLARVFEVFARHKKSVDVVATSEVGVSMTVDNRSLISQIVEELQQFADVQAHYDRAVVCVVGEGMKQTKGIAARVFTALGNAGVNVELISHGGSEINLTFVIREDEVLRAVEALHDEFFCLVDHLTS